MRHSRATSVTFAVRQIALVTGAVILSACFSLDSSTSTFRYGSIAIRAASGGVGPITARPSATFFTGQDSPLPSSRVQAGQCSPQFFNPEASVPGNLSGGASLDLRVGTTSLAMTEQVASSRVYTLSGAGTFTYNVGDSVQITVPGAAGGFPGGQVAVRLAEPIRVGDYTEPTEGQNFSLTWQSNGDANSGVLISLRYASVSSTGNADRQLLCVVPDNGSFLIGQQLLNDYVTSPESSREINVSRWRTNNVSVDERSRLYIVTSTDTTLVKIN